MSPPLSHKRHLLVAEWLIAEQSWRQTECKLPGVQTRSRRYHSGQRERDRGRHQLHVQCKGKGVSYAAGVGSDYSLYLDCQELC